MGWAEQARRQQRREWAVTALDGEREHAVGVRGAVHDAGEVGSGARYLTLGSIAAEEQLVDFVAILRRGGRGGRGCHGSEVLLAWRGSSREQRGACAALAERV